MVASLLLNVRFVVETRDPNIEFTLGETKKGGVPILLLNGYLGNKEFCLVEKALVQLFEQGHDRVIFDLTGLLFTTTMSLAGLLICWRKSHPHSGEFKLVGLSPELGRLAVMAGFNGERDFEPDMATALKKISPMPKVKSRPSPNRK